MDARTVIGALALGLCTVTAAAGQSDAPAISAQARGDIINNDGAAIGEVLIRQGPQGIVVNISAHGLPPGACAPLDTFAEAAGHIIPHGRPHGFFHAEGPHAGNLPNLIVAADGTVEVELYSELLLLDRGPGMILDEDGSTLVIHVNEDDHFTQPIGGSGGRIGCAVIEPVTN